MSRLLFVCCLEIAVTAHLVVQAADGDLDVSFRIGTGATGGNPYLVVSALNIDGQGRIVVGGSFTNFNGVSVGSIVRLLPSGEVDSTFQSGTGFDLQPGGGASVQSITTVNATNLLVGGQFTSYNGAPCVNLAMLLPDGSKNPDFAPPLAVNNIVHAAVAQPGKGILALGSFDGLAGANGASIIRLTATGAIDASFHAPSTGDFVAALAVKDDGKILIGGAFTQIGAQPATGLARLNPDGDIDTTFQASFASPVGGTPSIAAISLAPGQLVVGGGFMGNSGSLAPLLRSLNPDGSQRVVFTESAFPRNSLIYTVQVSGDLKVVAGAGISTDALSSTRRSDSLVERFNEDGSEDTSFSPIVLEELDLPAAYALALQTNGFLVVGGAFYSADGQSYNGLCRVTNTVLPRLLNPSVTNATFQFESWLPGGSTYSLEYLHALPGVWQELEPLAGTGSWTTYQLALNVTNTLFRIKQQ